MRNPWWKVLDAARADRRRHSEPPTRISVRGPLRLEWLAIAMALSAGGCIAPCASGVCSSPASLFRLPTPRYNATESLIDNGCVEAGCGEVECEKGTCKPQPYYTFNKYCPWLDEWHTTSTAKRCANWILVKQQWRLLKLMPADYKKGFRQAFVDVAHGSEGELPAVPPPVYWNAHFRSDAGQQKAECWFAGYRAGAAMAAVQLAPMKRIAASYDWTVQKPKGPLAGGDCQPCGLMGQSQNNFLRPAGYQPTGGQSQPFVPGQSFGQSQSFGPGQSFGPPHEFGQMPPQQFGPQPVMNYPQMNYPQMPPQYSGPPDGPAPFDSGGPTGPVESLPAPPQQPAPMASPHSVPPAGGLAPGHSMPGQPAMTNPPRMIPQAGSANGGSLMPGFSGSGYSGSGSAPAAATGRWSDPPTEELVY